MFDFVGSRANLRIPGENYFFSVGVFFSCGDFDDGAFLPLIGQPKCFESPSQPTSYLARSLREVLLGSQSSTSSVAVVSSDPQGKNKKKIWRQFRPTQPAKTSDFPTDWPTNFFESPSQPTSYLTRSLREILSGSQSSTSLVAVISSGPWDKNSFFET